MLPPLRSARYRRYSLEACGSSRGMRASPSRHTGSSSSGSRRALHRSLASPQLCRPLRESRTTSTVKPVRRICECASLPWVCSKKPSSALLDAQETGKVTQNVPAYGPRIAPEAQSDAPKSLFLMFERKECFWESVDSSSLPRLARKIIGLPELLRQKIPLSEGARQCSSAQRRSRLSSFA